MFNENVCFVVGQIGKIKFNNKRGKDEDNWNDNRN